MNITATDPRKPLVVAAMRKVAGIVGGRVTMVQFDTKARQYRANVIAPKGATLAEDMPVDENGYTVLSYEDVHGTEEVGPEINGAIDTPIGPISQGMFVRVRGTEHEMMGTTSPVPAFRGQVIKVLHNVGHVQILAENGIRTAKPDDITKKYSRRQQWMERLPGMTREKIAEALGTKPPRKKETKMDPNPRAEKDAKTLKAHAANTDAAAPASTFKEDTVGKPENVSPCLCGCGEMVARAFKQGHDARYAGWLKRLAQGKEIPVPVGVLLDPETLKHPALNTPYFAPLVAAAKAAAGQ